MGQGVGKPSSLRRAVAVSCALLVLAACRSPSSGPDAKSSARPSAGGKSTSKPASAGPRGTGAAAALTTTSGTPAPKASAAPALLQAPKGASTPLSGTVRLDAGYLVAKTKAELISDKGAMLIANNGGGAVAAKAGGNVISNAGGLLTAGAVAGLIGANGSALIANNGGGLIANNGGGLISANGSGIIANNGGAVISNAGATYRLAATPAEGALTPAGGVEVGLWSLRRRGFLPLGVDADGKPVYSVFTDEVGGFNVHVPPEEAGNVMVVAVVDRAERDPRMTYGLVTPATGAGARTLDEDTAIATELVRQVFAIRIATALATGSAATFVDGFGGNFLQKNASLREDLIDKLGRWIAEAQRLGLTGDDATRRRVARRLSDFVLAGVDLAAVEELFRPKSYTGPKEKPLEAIEAIVRAVRLAGARKLAATPGFFDQAPWLSVVNQGRAAPIAIRKPADLGTLLVEGYLTEQDRDRLARLSAPEDIERYGGPGVDSAGRTLFRDLGVLELEPPADYTQIDRLTVASQNLVFTFCIRINTLDAAEIGASLAVIAE